MAKVTKEAQLKMISDLISVSIDKIWKDYDDDNSGNLDKKETREFVQKTLAEMGQSEEYNDADFDSYFKDITGKEEEGISKEGLKAYLLKIAEAALDQEAAV